AGFLWTGYIAASSPKRAAQNNYVFTSHISIPAIASSAIIISSLKIALQSTFFTVPVIAMYCPPRLYQSICSSEQGTKQVTVACGLFFRAALPLQVREWSSVSFSFCSSFSEPDRILFSSYSTAEKRKILDRTKTLLYNTIQ
ncbi:MAG: hypothetical protein IKF90_14335, partial [Parasporobacterium sp.]|nr:hypothetical protein [Parasporobacterium sp.]